MIPDTCLMQSHSHKCLMEQSCITFKFHGAMTCNLARYFKASLEVPILNGTVV